MNAAIVALIAPAALLSSTSRGKLLPARVPGACFVLASSVAVATLIAPSTSRAASVFVEAHGLGASPCNTTAPTTATCSSAAGSNQATSFADLASGVLDASAITQAVADARLTDAISLVLPTGYSAPDVPVTLTLTVPFASVSGNANIIDSLALGFTSQTGCIASGDQNCNVAGIIPGLNLSITEDLSLSALTNIFVQANLNPSGGSIHGSGSAVADPPFLDLILPTGVTFTSESGVFLTQPAGATPLPASLGLFGTGLAGLGLILRRKRKAA